MQRIMISIGNFFFRYRNLLFPIGLFMLFVLERPDDAIWGSEFLEETKDVIAALIVFSGLALRGLVIGYAYIKRGGLNKKVYAESLVTEGMFSLSRNPLYLGNMLIYAGVFLTHGNAWVITIGIGTFWFIYECIIRAEEQFLINKFGDAYRDYCRDVPRWIPNFSRFHAATQGMEFNARKVLIKDYPTMANACIALAVLYIYEDLVYYQFSDVAYYIYTSILAVLLSLIFSFSMHVLKKKKILSV